MNIKSSFIGFVVALGLAQGALGASSQPTTAAAPLIAPNGSVNGYSLGQLNSPTNYQVPRGHLRVWKPFPNNQLVDSGGGNFNNRTGIMTVEIPDDATMAQVVFANTGANSYTISAAGIWGSSQLETVGQVVTTAAGLSFYDGGGNALSALGLLSFGNNGADSQPNFGFPSAVPANSTNAVTSGSSTGTTLNFTAGFACPTLGATLQIIGSSATNNPLLWWPTTVSACNSGAGTLTTSVGVRNTVPTGTTVYFLPPNFVVPASPYPPLFNLTFSDWTPITTYNRLDGPTAVGQTLLNAGTPLGGTVASTTATSVTLSSNLGSGIPAGTTLDSCWSGVTSGTITPNLTLQFAANANIVPGMTVSPSATNQILYWWPQNAVASVSTSTNTTVTLSAPLPNNAGGGTTYNSGTTFTFSLPVTTTAQTLTNSAVLTLASTAGLSVGMSGQQSGGTGAIGGTIASINAGANQVTMTQNVSNVVPSGQALYFQFSANTNASATVANTVTISPAVGGILPGMHIVAPGFPANDYVYGYSSTAPVLTLSPTSAINSGTTVYFCNSVTTTATSAAGQPTINLVTTTWPNRLVTLREDIGSANANYWNPTNDLLGYWPNLPGTPQRWLNTSCVVSEGVLNASAITNTTTCGGNNFGILPYAIKFYSPRRGVTLAVVSDSHFAGNTSTGGMANLVTRAAYLLNSPSTLPVSVMNVAWGGMPSVVFNPSAMQLIRSVQPEMVFTQFTTPNDPTTNASVANFEAASNSIASYVRSYGGVPAMLADYQRQKYGCDFNAAGSETIRLSGEALLNSAAQAGAITLDLAPILADPVNGAPWFAPAFSYDCIHANDAGHAAMAAGLVNLLKPLLRY